MTLKEFRIKYNLTQKEVAEVLGVTESNICRIESGEVLLKVEYAKKLANLYEFDWTLFFPDN